MRYGVYVPNFGPYGDARILADLADDRAWTERFEATSAEQWDRLAALAHQEIAAGETVPLEEVFPPKVSGD